MNNNYINIYNNLIKLTRNKSLYINLGNKDSFSDRLLIFLLHFAFFLNVYKLKSSKKYLQEIYDFIFKQIEISIREVGHGDMSVNKKMKLYISIFHNIIIKIDKWETQRIDKKYIIFKKLLNNSSNVEFFVDYFDKYRSFLLNNTLNSFTKEILDLEI